MLMKVTTQPRDAAEPYVRGRSPEFRRYLSELKLTDPERYRQIVAAEAAQVPEMNRRQEHEEQIMAEQMEGYADAAGNS